jgi:hypothetical protein
MEGRAVTAYSYQCRCGSRLTKRVGPLERECQDCHRRWIWRLYMGVFIPCTRDVAEAIDEERRAS